MGSSGWGVWRRGRVVAGLVGLVGLAAVVSAGPAAAAGSVARPRVVHVYDSVGQRGTISAHAGSVAGRQVLGASITVRQGRRVLARNVSRVRVLPGVYRVTTTVRYRPWTLQAQQVPTTVWVDGAFLPASCTITAVTYQSPIDGFGDGAGTCTDPSGVYPPTTDDFMTWEDGPHAVGQVIAQNEYFPGFDKPTTVTRQVKVYGAPASQSGTASVAVRRVNTDCSTYQEYTQIRKGMSLAQVRRVFGERGTLTMDSFLRWYEFTDCGSGAVDAFEVAFLHGRVSDTFKSVYVR
jgi:hypothetical protein